MARVLVLVPDHCLAEREAGARLGALVEAAGHVVARSLPSESGTALDSLKRRVHDADAVVALLDGPVVDPEVVAVAALARAARRPCLGLQSDDRANLDPTTRALFDDVARLTAWDAPEAQQRVADFLAGVRVFAGALVRDSVPNILKQEGRELRFRQVADSEYPHVLKRKLVETAQRLEDADFGVEQEEIADVLELLETLINLRRYDKESLRSIKEGKWRKRGGFGKGYLVDEEPSLSSR